MLGKENDAVVTDSESFKYKVKIIGKTPAASNRKNIEIVVPLKYLSNFWRTLKISLINCEINLILTLPSSYIVKNPRGAGAFNSR